MKTPVSYRVIVLLPLLAACQRETPWSIDKADPATLRQTSLGPVIGGDGRYGNHAWLGIPFAAPPVGELRWRAPKPPTPWKETLQALKPADGCPQFGSRLGGLPGVRPGVPAGSEDCLYLNVTAPSFTPDHVPQGKDRLPVMLWIHGGGNTVGSTSMYDGGHLSTKENVVVVSTQYRLGPLGWFRHRALRGETQDAVEQSGNFGTLDLIRALQWVHENIAAFGGDPDNVTIFGESAGGGNVFTLLLAPQAKGLFQRAIVESGGLSETTVDEAENFVDAPSPGAPNSSNELLLKLIQRDGLAKDRASAQAHLAAMSDADIRAYLRSKTTADLLTATNTERGLGLIDMPLVFHDGALLPAGDFTERFADPAGWNRVPVILGSNHDEDKLFLSFNPHYIHWVLGALPKIINEQEYEATAEYVSRSWKASSVDRPAAAMIRSGVTDVYAYRFDWHGEPIISGARLGQIFGAAHALEIPFVFGHFDLGRLAERLFDKAGAPDREQLSNAMMSYWTEFAKTGSPARGQGGDLMPWTAWDESSPEKPKYIVLDTPSEGGIKFSSEVQTREHLYADIDADPRLPTQRDKCVVFRMLVGFTHGLTQESYVHAGKNGCADYPLADFPWEKK